ncbi:unnamed protein product, partial [Owenia fusiformis]
MGMLRLFACCLIFVILNGKDVQCKENPVTGIIKGVYLTEDKLTERFLKIDAKVVHHLLEVTTKEAKEYIKTLPEKDKDKRIVERSIKMMSKIDTRLKKFWNQLNKWNEIRVEVLNIMRYDSKAMLEMTDFIFKDTLHISNDIETYESDINYSFEYVIRATGLKNMDSNLLNGTKFTKDYRKSIDRWLDKDSNLKGMMMRLKEKLKQFYMVLKRLKKLTGWMVKSVLRLKIPEIDGSNNCNKQSEGVNFIKTDNGANFLAVCDSEWLVVAQRFDG